MILKGKNFYQEFMKHYMKIEFIPLVETFFHLLRKYLIKARTLILAVIHSQIFNFSSEQNLAIITNTA